MGTVSTGHERRQENQGWLHRPVLVTGCTGLLGSWLTESLANRGASAVGLVRDSVAFSNFNFLELSERVTVVRGEVENYPLLERILAEYEIEVVFHLAAQTIVGIANRSPLSTFESNIKGTWNVLEACRRASSIQRVVVASSDKAYGSHTNLPYREDSSLLGRHPYDVSKSCADLLAQSYAVTYGLPVCIARLGNLFGGGDLNFNRIVPGTIRSVLMGQSPVIRSDGKYVRDYIYVKDAAEAYILLAEKMAEVDLAGEAFNFSLEQPMDVLAITAKILKLLDCPDLEPTIHGNAPHEIREQYLSAKKARKVLGWRPLYTLEEGLTETIDWYRRFFKRTLPSG